jgi:acylglycerol lipase
MNCQESHFTTADGLKLLQRCWQPDVPPAAVVVLIHGLAEHSGRYAPLAQRLVAEGYAVRALDLRGHGRSEGRRIYIDSCSSMSRTLPSSSDTCSLNSPSSRASCWGIAWAG